MEIKKKILFIAPDNMGKRKGGGLAMKAYYNALRQLFPKCVDAMMPEEYCVNQYEDCIKVPRRSLLKVFLSGSIHRYRKVLHKYLKENATEYDCCVINGGLYAGDMMDMIHRYGLKIMVIHHNFEREYHMDNKDLWTLKGHYAGFVIHNEKRAYRKADVNCFLTIDDQRLFEKTYGKHDKNYVIGVFETDSTPLPDIKNEQNHHVIGITGSMNTVQTIEGVMNLKHNYLTILKQSFPEWKLIVAGRDPDKKIESFANDNNDMVTLIPNPENMADVIEMCNVFLCPTNVGGGLKLRVMDGLRQGLPILVHKVSARGYDEFYESPFFAVYDDAQSFEMGLRKLTGLQFNKDLRQMIQNAYQEKWGFDNGVRKMKETIAWM